MNSKGDGEERKAAEFVSIDTDFCRAFDEQEMDFCGDLANTALQMPFGIDNLPLCTRHVALFEGWTEDDTLREIVDLITDEESIRFLKEEMDDDL